MSLIPNTGLSCIFFPFFQGKRELQSITSTDYAVISHIWQNLRGQPIWSATDKAWLWENHLCDHDISPVR